MARLHLDMPTYTAAANGLSIEHGDLGDFTKRILRWLKSHASGFGAWSEAARMAPNSEGAERVLSLLKILFGSNQDTTLPDSIFGSVVLRYSNNKRANEARKKS